MAFGATVILGTPLPYDDITEGDTEIIDCQSGFKACREAVLRIASKYQIRVIDFQKRFLSLMPTIHPISQDRLHPTQFGYHVLGQLFLEEIGEVTKADFNTPLVLEKWNQERQSVEKTIKLLDFIDYVLLYNESKEKGLTVSEKIELCKKRLAAEANQDSYIALFCNAYVKHGRKREELTERLIQKTPRPY